MYIYNWVTGVQQKLSEHGKSTVIKIFKILIKLIKLYFDQRKGKRLKLVNLKLNELNREHY